MVGYKCDQCEKYYSSCKCVEKLQPIVPPIGEHRNTELVAIRKHVRNIMESLRQVELDISEILRFEAENTER